MEHDDIVDNFRSMNSIKVFCLTFRTATSTNHSEMKHSVKSWSKRPTTSHHVPIHVKEAGVCFPLLPLISAVRLSWNLTSSNTSKQQPMINAELTTVKIIFNLFKCFRFIFRHSVNGVLLLCCYEPWNRCRNCDGLFAKPAQDIAIWWSQKCSQHRRDYSYHGRKELEAADVPSSRRNGTSHQYQIHFSCTGILPSL